MMITAAVEGPTDEAVLRKVINFAGPSVGQVHGRNGKPHLLRSLAGFNHAAQFSPWVVLIDLDQEACLLNAMQNWLPAPASLMCLRIAVRELEAWLLSDTERFSSFFSVSYDLIPTSPDTLDDPKQTLINLVRRSRRRAVREDIVPDPRLGQSIGPAYTTRLIEFLRDDEGWRVEVAIERSPSLRRAVAAIQALALRADQLRT